VLRISARLKCRFCTQTHTAVAMDAGLSVPEVRALRDQRAPMDDLFHDTSERALIAWSDRFADSGPITDEDHAILAAHFAPYEIVELAMIAGATMMLNRFCTALSLPPSDAVVARLAAEGLS